MPDESSEGLAAKSKISGRVYSEEGAMLSGAKVACDGVEALTLADGYYVLNQLPSGTFEVHVNIQGFKQEKRRVTLKDNEAAVLDFKLSKATGSSRISGHVYNSETNEIINDGTVILILPISNKYARININGYYEFSDLPAGEYKIYTSIPEDVTEYITLRYGDCETLITIADSESRTFDFYCKVKRMLEPPWG